MVRRGRGRERIHDNGGLSNWKCLQGRLVLAKGSGSRPSITKSSQRHYRNRSDKGEARWPEILEVDSGEGEF